MDEELISNKDMLGELRQKVLDAIDKYAQELYTQITPILSNALTELSKTIQDAMSDFCPEGGDYKAVVNNLSNWGEYGWALLDFADMELYCQAAPIDYADADRKALVYCTDEEIHNLLVRMEPKVSQTDDFKESVYCYEHNKWKPCAMLLFAMIDHMLIRFQPIANGKSRRKTGDKAVKFVEDAVDNAITQKSSMILFANHRATLRAIGTVYAGGDDFSNENPNVVNRNFICHGMARRAVTRTDCIKLFVILDGLIQLFDYYGLTYKS